VKEVGPPRRRAIACQAEFVIIGLVWLLRQYPYIPATSRLIQAAKQQFHTAMLQRYFRITPGVADVTFTFAFFGSCLGNLSRD